jgi:predicted GIY-YIG superfamily endonuclease
VKYLLSSSLQMAPKAKPKPKAKAKPKAADMQALLARLDRLEKDQDVVEQVEESESEEEVKAESEPEEEEAESDDETTVVRIAAKTKRWDTGFNAKVQQACKGKVYVYMLGVNDPNVKFYVGIVYQGKHALWTRLRNHRRGKGGDTGDDRRPTREMLPVWLVAAIEVPMKEIAKAYEDSLHKIQLEKTVEKSAEFLLKAAAKCLKDHPTSAVQLELEKEQNAKYNHAGGKNIHGAGIVPKYYPHYAARLIQRWFRKSYRMMFKHPPFPPTGKGSFRQMVFVRAKFVKLAMRLLRSWKARISLCLQILSDSEDKVSWMKGDTVSLILDFKTPLAYLLPKTKGRSDRLR